MLHGALLRSHDAALAREHRSIARLEDIASDAHQQGRNVTDGLEWMGLIDAGSAAKRDRDIGYFGPHHSSRETLGEDRAVQEEVRNAARSVVNAVKALRAGTLKQPDAKIKWPPRK